MKKLILLTGLLVMATAAWAAPPTDYEQLDREKKEAMKRMLEDERRKADQRKAELERRAMHRQMGERLAKMEAMAEHYEAQGKHEHAAKIRAAIKEVYKRMGVARPVAEAGPRVGGLELVVTAPAKVELGQPIPIKAAIRWLGRSEVKLAKLGPDCLAKTANPRLSFIIWHADGKPVALKPAPPAPPVVQPRTAGPPAPAPDFVPPAMRVPDIITLKGKQKHVLSDSPHFKAISDRYLFDRPGKYTFQVNYTAKAATASGAKFKPVDLISNPVDILVVPKVASDLSMTISLKNQLVLKLDDGGTKYQLFFNATITNNGKQAVTLVGAGDGSSRAWRTPIIGFSVINVADTKAKHPDSMPPIVQVRGCGKMSGPAAKEIVRVAPGGSVTFSDWLSPGTFFTGTYRVVFYYRNDPALRWRGLPLAPGGHNSKLMDRVKTSTPCTLKSKELRITVGPS